MSYVITSDVNHRDYDEADALQNLLLAATDALEEMFKQQERDINDFSPNQFSINIGGKSIAILLGAVQYQALCDFIDSIAAENGYTVDINNCTVGK
jgi:hypothetical protein